MSAAVTAQQQKVFDFMVAFYIENDELPSSPVIARAFGYASNNAAHEMVIQLHTKGLLEKNEGGNYRFTRGIRHPGWAAIAEKSGALRLLSRGELHSMQGFPGLRKC